MRTDINAGETAACRSTQSGSETSLVREGDGVSFWLLYSFQTTPVVCSVYRTESGGVIFAYRCREANL